MKITKQGEEKTKPLREKLQGETYNIELNGLELAHLAYLYGKVGGTTEIRKTFDNFFNFLKIDGNVQEMKNILDEDYDCENFYIKNAAK